MIGEISSWEFLKVGVRLLFFIRGASYIREKTVFTGDSCVAIQTALGLDSYLRLLDGHMGCNRYRFCRRLMDGHVGCNRHRKLQETLGWPTWVTIGQDNFMRYLGGHMGRKFTLPRNLHRLAECSLLLCPVKHFVQNGSIAWTEPRVVRHRGGADLGLSPKSFPWHIGNHGNIIHSKELCHRG